MRKKTLGGIVLLVAIVAAIAASLVLPELQNGPRGRTIGIIDIEGVIAGGQGYSGLFDSASGSDIILHYLEEALWDDNIAAVVIRLNSPGGSAAAAQEIGNQIKRLRSAGKIVVASMGDVAASGGYWVAAVTDYIVANPATMTGSIGVFMEIQNLQGLYGKLGIDFEMIKSGPLKDIGNPNRPMTDTERDLLQAMVNDIYNQFIDAIMEGRNLTRAQVEAVADGRIMTGRQALEAGLIDQFGSIYDAIGIAAQMAGIQDRYRTQRYGELSNWEILLYRLFTKLDRILLGSFGGGAVWNGLKP